MASRPRPPRAFVRRLSLFLALALLTACFRIPAPDERLHGMGRAATHALPAKTRVLVWNIYKSNRDSWTGEFTALARSHDLLLLQEGWWDDATRPTYTAIAGMRWWLGVTFEFPYACDVPKTGTMIGSRARPTAPIFFLHSPYRDALANTPKSHIAGSFALEGASKPLLAVSVHATNFHIEQRPFELHVDQILETVRGHDGPVLLAGDFNTWSESRTAYLFDHTRALGLHSIYPRGPATEHEGDGRMTWSDNYLDHAFTRDLVVSRDARVLREIDASDHTALSFVVSVAPESKRANPR